MLKNILAVVLALVLGGSVNMGLIMVSGSIIPPPEGIDPTNMESLKASMHLYEAKHFIFPFLAHALGTLVGAFIAAKVASSRKMTLAMVIGGFFMLGGITNAFLLPAPIWFIALDIVLAYLPMAWLGGKLGTK
ncbi:hypothetical protein [Pleionea mediterranea]|uniref:Uncharacterized protein n=1 Tax=Pleionea mediterranea TaxID=523701 RepID=A0A316FXN4_9GAMM|nr:hypothetical protein [Pleionea mediterranea]PWK52875.1 hypothetical protein C8D97_10493 [Pleionea mediterranea]